MRIPSFQVKNQRAIKLAKCDKVPRLMVIAGPNGCGKSTLLNALRSLGGEQTVLYVGPHRNARRQNVVYRHLLTQAISIEALLARSDTPGYEGIQLIQGSRDPWSFDDTSNYLKHALCQIEVDRQQAILARYDQEGEIPKGVLPDPWSPLKTLTSNLLPHLVFSAIDASNKDFVRCIWKVHGTDVPVDLDDLSSGEKSIVQMFYPLIEHQVRDILNEIRKGPKAQDRPELCVLIDEPELHLHPNLQVKVVDYLRFLTANTKTQVIVATHSPTIVEQAHFEELYLLRPTETVSEGDNQLVQIATDEERLHVLRELFGGIGNLTAMQPIVVVESTGGDSTQRGVPDRKLYKALHDGFDRVTVIPGGGRTECFRLREALSAALTGFTTKNKVIALVDRDLKTSTADKDVYLLPVSMIENFLLDPEAIWAALQPVAPKTSLSRLEDVVATLDMLLEELEVDEIERRVIVRLGYCKFQPKRPVADLQVQVESFIKDITLRFNAVTATTHSNEAQKAITSIKSEKKRREFYHGKGVLEEFYKRCLSQTGLSRSAFIFQAAQHARNRKAVSQFFDGFFKEISPLK